MSNIIEYQIYAPEFDAKINRGSCSPQKGQRIVYEDEEAEVIRVTPLMVIKTKNGVVCGAIEKRSEYA